IAGIIAMRPKYIVFDEPTAMLDPQGRREVIQTMQKLNKEEHITIINITHYMEEAVLADRIIVMDKGDIALTGTPREVFAQVDTLKKLRLDVPVVTELAQSLPAEMHLPHDILTIDELVVNLCR
ncbi:MAG: energy-coupling factor transporter ATPase, partial [Clostridiales bacterium]